MTIKFFCAFCSKESHFDPDKVQRIVDLMESQGTAGAQPRAYRVQCSHCQRWQEVKINRSQP